MSAWDELENKLADIRAALDTADDCQFGRLSKLLDKLAVATDDAMRIAAKLRASAR